MTPLQAVATKPAFGQAGVHGHIFSLDYCVTAECLVDSIHDLAQVAALARGPWASFFYRF